jgi:SIR2-like domain
MSTKERLIELARSGEYILFLGAGFSKESGSPLWHESLELIAEKLRPFDPLYPDLIKYETQKERYLVAAEQLYLAPVDQSIRNRIIQDVFGYEGAITARQKRLLKSPRQGIVTTNFDRNVERASREAAADLVFFTESDGDICQARVCDRPFAVRLHGRVESPEGLVFSQSQYDVARARPEYQEFFREIFVGRNVIFFGFSFADPLITKRIIEMSSAVHSIFRRQAFALFPAAPTAALEEILRQAGVTPVIYSPDNGHDEAWALLVSARTSSEAASPDRYRADWIRAELAAVYARSRARGFAADRIQVMAGLLTSLLSTIGVGAELTATDFEAKSRQFLALPDSVARSDLSEAIKRLERDGLIKLQEATIKIVSVGDLSALGRDLGSLVDGLVARAEVRYGIKIELRDRTVLSELLTAILVVNGLHIAHSFIRRRPLNELDLRESVESAARLVALPARLRTAGVMNAIVHFITHPDAGEERLLGELAHLAFVTSLTVVDPVLSSSVAAAVAPSVYIDASVLLPWVSRGHPLEQPYGRIIAALGKGTRLVIPEYINELVSHKRLAMDAVQEAGLDDPERFARYIMLFEARGVNTFLGGYAGTKASGFAGSFEEYLRAYVPFETEAEAATFLVAKGLAVAEGHRGRAIEGGPLFGELRAAFLDRRKDRSELVMGHDAKQLELLLGHRPRSECPYFVTADKTLINVVPYTRAREVLNRILLPQQAAYLADLVNEDAGTMTGFTKALWSTPRDLPGRIRDYYTDRVLGQYEYALLEDMPKIVEAVVDDIESASGSVLVNWKDSEPDRVKLFNNLDRFETKFYERLLEAKRRAGIA